ncbi:unnamed protein product [Sphenostylis stenocarpa]|uniref:Uncharacterized protein n=1 Tax=Sphenostylis stenocarpa TaxID=92480 RepID=A0AA86SVW2_9FABA|nr:unnamed protein product [Sphenostylis stenocarpa]
MERPKRKRYLEHDRERVLSSMPKWEIEKCHSQLKVTIDSGRVFQNQPVLCGTE